MDMDLRFASWTTVFYLRILPPYFIDVVVWGGVVSREFPPVVLFVCLLFLVVVVLIGVVVIGQLVL